MAELRAGAAAGAGGRVAIERVFARIEIKRREFHGAEIMQLVEQAVEVVVRAGAADQRVQLFAFGHLLTQLGGERLHLVGKGFVVVFHFFGSNVAAGGEHMAVLGDFG